MRCNGQDGGFGYDGEPDVWEPGPDVWAEWRRGWSIGIPMPRPGFSMWHRGGPCRCCAPGRMLRARWRRHDDDGDDANGRTCNEVN